MNTTFNSPKRVQKNLLSDYEKRFLIRIAQKLPPQIHSDHLTSLGFLGMLLAGISYWLSQWNAYALVLCVFWLVVNWFGDSLDGTLARVRNRQRPRYGFYVDHITDAIGTFFLMGGLALSSYMNPFIALGLLIAYLLLSIEVYLTTHPTGAFP